MSRVLAFVALSLLASLSAAGPTPQSELPELLRKAVSKSRKARYVGVRVVQFRRGPESIRHTEYVTRDGPRLRIEFPRDSKFAGQIIVEGKTERRHFFPERNEIHVLPPRREEAFERLAKLIRSRGRFRFSSGADAQVAGKTTEQVVVADPAGNVVQRLFIEPRSGMVLKRDLFDPVGTRVGGFEFTEIDFKPTIDASVFRLVRRGARVLTPAMMLEELAKREGFRPVVLPATEGVRLEWSAVRKMAEEEVLVQSYAAGDGRLTLFQHRRIMSLERLKELASRGRVNFVYWRRDGRTFVLVGNQAVDELRRIAGPIAGGTLADGG